ncbi:MAG: benzoate/H(+) symporter BenE family transporter [Pseudomonadota bacterium]|nr:benzoate/H(+) symporter BenE family transporter [Pseudomonadota bacterium]
MAAFVGFAGSFAIVVQGLYGVGASGAEAASGLMILSVSMGLCAVFLALRTRMPISVAWSTPGAAFLATLAPTEGGFSVAVGAFIVTAMLIILAGLWKPLGRAVSAIPKPLASAMLAGVLLPLCLTPFEAIAAYPYVGLPIVVVWAVVARINRLFAVPAAVLVTAVLIVAVFDVSAAEFDSLWSSPVVVRPSFTVAGVMTIALPLFIITMAGQNITGIAVLGSFGYKLDAGAMFGWTGMFSLASAPFGGHAVNLAAITTAICAGEEAHPDPDKRYWAAIVGGVTYIIFGLTAGAAIAFISLSPPILIASVAGLALIGALSSSLVSSLGSERDREAALITFLVTASGLSFFGISGVFWGLLAGGAIYYWDRR